MTRLIIWRHGQTTWNVENRIQGQQDVPLDDTGRAQAEAAADMLAAERVDLVVSSDLRRARDTAAAFTARTGLPVHTDQRLRERAYGDWEGLTHDEITRRWPEEFARWKRGENVPECRLEDPSDVAKRVREALLDFVDQVGDGTLLVVCHGGAARQGMGAVLEWPTSVIRAIGPLANCHWSELRRDKRGWRLSAHNVGPRLVPHAAVSPDESAGPEPNGGSDEGARR